MVGRGEVTDAAWARIEPLLPGGGRWADHRRILNGMLWRERTGAPWRDLPKRYGPWTTVYERFRRWAADGTWDRVLTGVIVKSDAVGAVEWTISVDSTPPARRRCPPQTREGQKGECQITTGTSDARPTAAREGIGRSRGGLTSKVHLACD